MPGSFTIGRLRNDDVLTPAVVLPLLNQRGDEVAWLAYKHIPYRSLDRIQVVGIWVDRSLQRRGIGRRLVSELLNSRQLGPVLVDSKAYTSAGEGFWPKMIVEGYAEPI